MELYFRQFGAGKNIVILHGLFGSSDNWNTLGKKFSEEFNVITVDQRNHGQSFHHEEFTYDAMAQDLEQLFKSISIEKATIIGHSMGGKTAMKFAIKHPEQLDKLIIVDIAPRQYPIHHDYIIDALCELDIKKYKRRNEVEKALSEHIKNKAVRLFLLKNLDQDSQGNLQWKINLPVIRKNLGNVGEEIKADEPVSIPALFIAGEESNYISKDDEAHIKKLFPNSEIVYLPDTGHWVHAESPDRFFTEVKKFVTG